MKKNRAKSEENISKVENLITSEIRCKSTEISKKNSSEEILLKIQNVSKDSFPIVYSVNSNCKNNKTDTRKMFLKRQSKIDFSNVDY